MARVPADNSAAAIQAAFRDVWIALDKLQGQIDLKNKGKITGAVDGADRSDYATLGQVKDMIQKLTGVKL
jgi:hypothetical protein